MKSSFDLLYMLLFYYTLDFKNSKPQFLFLILGMGVSTVQNPNQVNEIQKISCNAGGGTFTLCKKFILLRNYCDATISPPVPSIF